VIGYAVAWPLTLEVNITGRIDAFYNLINDLSE